MCLSIPAKIISIDKNEAIVAIGTAQSRASLDLVPEAKIDDYVLVHAGFALELIDKEEAEETLRLFKEYQEATEEAAQDGARKHQS